MDTKSLEVLGISPLRESSFLVYFSDRTYATVSAQVLASHFPSRQIVPKSVSDGPFSDQDPVHLLSEDQSVSNSRVQ